MARVGPPATFVFPPLLRVQQTLSWKAARPTRSTESPLVNAQVVLTGTQHDCAVIFYTLLAAVGRLEPEVLRLRVGNAK
jgi:hypothetical protein